MIKKVICCLLALTMVFGLLVAFPEKASAEFALKAEEVQLDEQVFMETSSGGEFDYSISSNKVIIDKYNGTAVNLTIPSVIEGYTVTSIGRSAFKNCLSLKKVIIPDSVTGIGFGAFEGCNNLESITIPFVGGGTSFGQNWGYFGYIFGNTVQEQYWGEDLKIPASLKEVIITGGTIIDAQAFLNCYYITNVSFPDTLKEIWFEAFANCGSLKSLYIPAGVELIQQDDNIAFDCPALESIVVNENNTTYHSSGNCLIETSTNTLVLGCKNSIIPDDGSVTKIGGDAFYGCFDLKSIIIPDTVTSIGAYAFRSCRSLTSFTIPASVTELCEYMLEGCDRLETITFEGDAPSITKGPVYGSKVIKATAYYPCSNTTYTSTAKNNIGSGLKWTKSHVPAAETEENRNEVSCTRNGSYDMVTYCTECGDELQRETIITAEATGHDYGEWVVVREADYTQAGIKQRVCSRDVSHIETEEIPMLETITGTCGISAHWMIQGDKLTVYGTGAMRSFANKTSMPWYDYLDQVEEIIIEEGVTSIGNYAFAGCANVTSVTIDSDVASIGVNAFSGCSKLETISLPASLTSISNYAFNNCSALSLIEFNSAAAPSLGANALANTKATAIYKSSWSGFAKDKFGGKTTWLIDHVNGSCGATKYSLDRGTLTISGTGTIRGYSKGEAPWYSMKEEVQKVVIGDGVTSIGNFAFHGCENMSELTLGSSVTTIGTSAFYGCAALDEVAFPASLTELKAYAFSNCSGLSELTFEGEAVPVIASTALNAVRAKAVHTDSENWSEFGGSGFGGAIYWTDDPEEEVLGGSCGGQAAWTFVDGTLTIYGENGTRGYSKKTDVPWYEYRDQITKIVVEDGITSLGNYSFMECENVTEVYLSNTLTFIGVNAFSTCSKLTSITIPATVKTINGYAFNKCYALERVVFEGDTAPTISKNAFNADAANLYYRASSSWKAFDKIGFSGKNVWREYADSSITLPPDSI